MTAETIHERESRRLRLQAELDAVRTQAERNRLGQFATPPRLAEEIVRAALALLPPLDSIRFLDPAFGTGSFYGALLRVVPRSRLSDATGYEVDPHYGQPARQLWDGTGLQLQLADFTQAVPSATNGARANLLVCNPPYVRHHHLTVAQKLHLQRAAGEACGIALNGLSGLYCYFLCLAHRWMADDGLAAWLVPSEFLDVNYGGPIKRYLLERVSLLRIHRFDPAQVQFDDALVSSAVVFFRNTVPTATQEVEFTFGGTLDEPTLSERIPAARLRTARKWTAFPDNGRSSDTEPGGGTLADLFQPKRGLATGCNEFFILTPERAVELDLPRRFLTPILPSPRLLDTDEIPADADGQPLLTHRRSLLSCDLSPEQVHAEYPALWRYLQSGVEAGIAERYLCRHRQPWYVQEIRRPAPFLCTYMGRQGQRGCESPFRFLLNHSRATAANVYLLLYPRPALAAALRRRPALHRVVWQALASITPGQLLGEGRVYGGGLHKLEPKELANVPARMVLDALDEEFDRHKQRSLFDAHSLPTER